MHRALGLGMGDIQSFRNLLVWRKSMDLAVRCYRTAQGLPKSEQQVLGYRSLERSERAHLRPPV
jgi:hypothetical protein